MAKVKMLQGMASANWAYSPGDIVEVNEKTAKAWEEAYIAEIAGDSDGAKGSKSSNKRASGLADGEKPSKS